MRMKLDLKIFVFALFFFLMKQSTIYLLVLLFAAIHEIGHLLAGLCLGLKPQSINIMPMGLSIEFKPQKEKWSTSFLVSLAGPMVNFTIAGILLAIGNFPWRETCIYANLLVGIFNLLPIYPLDGGRMLKAILKRKYDVEFTDEIIHSTSNIVMVLLTVLASISILYLQNIAILFIIAYLWLLRMIDNRKYQLKKRVQRILKREKVKVSL